MKRSILLAATCLGLSLHAAPPAPSSLEAGFQHPPDSAKPQTWWHWMNGNISKAGITADLEAMKEIGLGGATIVNVDCKIPRGPVNFMSPEWRDDFKFSVQEAARLGLDLTVENCAGWSSSGGPWNTPEHGMQKVTTSETTVTGPKQFSAPLPQPQTKLDFYRDIAVLAFPDTEDASASMKAAAPTASSSGDSASAKNILDNDEKTVLSLPSASHGKPQFAQLAFKTPFSARTVEIVGAQNIPECSGEITVSDDGKKFRSVKAFAFGRRGSNRRTVSLGNQPVTAAYWRVQFNTVSERNKGAKIPLAEIELSPRLGIENIEAKAGFEGKDVAFSDLPIEAVKGAIPAGKVIDLTSKLKDGKLDWKVPAGNWVIVRFGYTPIGVENHPAPAEGTGLECDKMSKVALDLHWDGFMKKVLEDVGPLAGKTLTTSLIDSYEVGGQNWTKDFRDEFKKRRGYDLLSYLPTFTGRVVENPTVSERFLWDIRRTIADLFAENYFGHFAELCRKHGLLNATEPYSGPMDCLQSGGPADVVMGEFWSGSTGHPSIKLASSIAHTYGKTFVGAESFTAKPEAGRWLNDPYSLKTLGDLMFCQGLNRYIFHRYAMQPWTDRFPGMTMGQWGFHFERTVTWWKQGKSWIDYISRCEFLLQQGRAVNDAAYFQGESAPVFVRKCEPKLPNGYDYDLINADVLLKSAKVKGGRVTLASGASYAALILPTEDPNPTPELLERVAELARAGATIVGPRPQHSPSLANYPGCDKKIQKLADELWGKCDGKTVFENKVGKGRVVWGKTMAEIFAAQALTPDFEFAGASPETKLAYGHRVSGQEEIYFVSNQRTQSDSAEATFRVTGKTPELWNPETGLIERAPVWQEKDGRTTVRLTFDPAGSVFVIFRSPADGDHAVTAKVDATWQTVLGAKNELLVKAGSNGTAEFVTSSGKALKAEATNIPSPQTIEGSWSLKFPPHWGAPESVSLEKLISWTDHADNGVRYFSGTATYEKEITIAADQLSAGRELWLDLGQVKNFAEVSLNGKELGVLWKPPFKVNLTAAATSGVNKLAVKITNLWPNRLIGDEQLPADCEWAGPGIKEWPQWLLDGKPSPTGRLTFTTWHHWTKDSPLVESGLLGPVTLRTAELIPAK